MANDEQRPRSGDDARRDATDVEREGMDLLGRSGVRDDALPGVSDASARADQDVETRREDLGSQGDRGADRSGATE